MPESLKAEPDGLRSKTSKSTENTSDDNVINYIIGPQTYKLRNLSKIYKEVKTETDIKSAIKLIQEAYKKSKGVLAQIKDTAIRNEANSNIDKDARGALLKLLEYASKQGLSISGENPLELGKSVDKLRALEQAELKKLLGMSENDSSRQSIIQNAQQYEKDAEKDREKMIQITDKILAGEK